MVSSRSGDARVTVGRVQCEVANLGMAVDRVLKLATERAGVSVRLTNAYSVALANDDPGYAGVLAKPGLNFPDGTPLVWAMRWRAPTGSLCETVRGPSLFRGVLASGRGSLVRHFFLGTTPETLGRLRSCLDFQYPGVVVAGMYAPEFGPLSQAFYADCVARIAECNPDVVWVGLGTPKQDFAAAELSRRTGVVHVAVGAAFDFVAGTTPEAPAFFQNSGFEWLYRFWREPRRLWKRYVFGNLRFLIVVASDLVRQNRSAPSGASGL